MLEPEIQKFIDDFKQLNIDYMSMPVEEARDLCHKLASKRPRLDNIPPTNISTQNLSLPGREIGLRIYKPSNLSQQKLPAIVYFHGGGFVWGLAEFYDDPCSILAGRTQSTIISVNYRYAPEFPFPAGLNDCYESFCYIQKHATQFNVKGDDISVAGDSAGGTLAAAVCLRARDEKGPIIRSQLLIYPGLEYNLEKKSFREMGKDYILTTDLIDWFYSKYLPNKEDRTNPLAMPLNAKDLSRLPPALIITANYDPLCDDGSDYAARLRDAGNKVKLICYETMNHGFIVYGALSPVAQRNVEEIAAEFAKLKSI